MNRIQQLQQQLTKKGCAVLVQQETNREYLVDFLSSAGTVFITDKNAYFIIDSRYVEVARRKVTDAQVLLQGKLYEQIASLCEEEGVHTLLIEKELTIADWEGLKEALPAVTVEPSDELSDLIRGMRGVKTQEEVQRICAAQAITDAAFSEILNVIRPGVTEREVAAQLEYLMRCKGADGLAFETIVASGTNGSMPHAVPSDKPIQLGEFVTMDFGAKKDGYCSDMTRTVAVGAISDEQQKVYDTVYEAHMAATKAAKGGVFGDDLDRVARELIYGAGYEGCFGHSLGHSLGLDIHERPMATFARHELLPVGTVVTIEPGIYLEGRFGVRIENMILLTEDGCENLTGSPRELITL